jgi:hypothetical protein
MEKIFESMKFADININVCGCQFKAQRSFWPREVHFSLPCSNTKQKKFWRSIGIEDIEPDVFKVILHFLYTGRLSGKNGV